eukprot:3386476-Prymnesium_polylepis.1
MREFFWERGSLGREHTRRMSSGNGGQVTLHDQTMTHNRQGLTPQRAPPRQQHAKTKTQAAEHARGERMLADAGGESAPNPCSAGLCMGPRSRRSRASRARACHVMFVRQSAASSYPPAARQL